MPSHGAYPLGADSGDDRAVVPRGRAASRLDRLRSGRASLSYMQANVTGWGGDYSRTTLLIGRRPEVARSGLVR